MREQGSVVARFSHNKVIIARTPLPSLPKQLVVELHQERRQNWAVTSLSAGLPSNSVQFSNRSYP